MIPLPPSAPVELLVPLYPPPPPPLPLLAVPTVGFILPWTRLKPAPVPPVRAVWHRPPGFPNASEIPL